MPEKASGSGRLELANWLTRPDHPLTARVMANRIWQHHFGQGLVKTPNDFGVRGQPPAHPELLDHISTLFVRNGWSLKAMHRLIMTSAVYQQACHYSAGNHPASEPPQAAPLKTDSPMTDYSANFSPFPRRRLAAEEIRDAILFVSGELDTAPGQGHPFPAPTSWGYTQHSPFSAVYDHNKRSVYLMTQRIKRHPFLTLFDGADPNASTAERRLTIVPTQALYFLNDPFVHVKAEKFAARLQRAAAGDEGRVELAYRLAFGRSSTAAERAGAAEFLATYRAEPGGASSERTESAAWAAYARVLFGSNEFLCID